jgi:hypothetical protein
MVTGLWWLAATLADGAENHALLVGCTKYDHCPNVRELYGPRNDVPMFAELLEKQFGFAGDRIQVFLDWPEYEARCSMSATSAIREYIDFVGTNEKWNDETAKNHLVAKGVPELVADDAVRFTPIAFGRAFMESLGVELSNQYICFRADGSVARSGELDQNEAFRTALELARELRDIRVSRPRPIRPRKRMP